jgi:hypothetical protein
MYFGDLKVYPYPQYVEIHISKVVVLGYGSFEKWRPPEWG